MTKTRDLDIRDPRQATEATEHSNYQLLVAETSLTRKKGCPNIFAEEFKPWMFTCSCHRNSALNPPSIALTDSRDRSDDFAQFQLVEDRGLAGGIQPNCKKNTMRRMKLC